MTDSTHALLDWSALVAETKRRRKQEKLTQKEHAALAGVSIPTIAAFDRGEQSLTLAKAFDILRVVGLVEEAATSADAQDAFVQAAMTRWRELTAKLPEDSPARFPHGHYRVDYCFDGEFKTVKPEELLETLRRTQSRHTGWIPFGVSTETTLLPISEKLVVESSVATGGNYWLASPDGRMILLCPYDEDGQETFPPGSIFDFVLPVWRIGEILLHAGRLGRLLARDTAATALRFRAVYTGLKGRELRSWSNPRGRSPEEGSIARGDEAVLQGILPLANLEADLAGHVTHLLAPLYERFRVATLSPDFVAAELARMRTARRG